MSKELEKLFKKALEGALYSGIDAFWDRALLQTGIAALDRALGGGFAYGTLAEIAGEWGSCKTILLYIVLGANQRRGGTSVLYESEGAYYPDWYTHFGDPKTLLVRPIKTVEEFFGSSMKLLKVMEAAKKRGKNDLCAIGWDGIAATGTEHLQKVEMQPNKQGKIVWDMSKARRMTEGCQLITRLVENTNTLVIATNQLRVDINANPWDRPHTPGGKGWPFHSSQRVFLDFLGGPVGSQIRHDNKQPIGRKVEGEVIKSRVGPPFRKFTMPTYTEEGYPHPVWEGEETKVGVDLEESIWNWIVDKRSTFKVRNKAGMLERRPFIKSSGPTWELAPEIRAYLEQKKDETSEWLKRKFYKKHFKAVLDGMPQLRDPQFDPSNLCSQCHQFTPEPTEILCVNCRSRKKVKKK